MSVISVGTVHLFVFRIHVYFLGAVLGSEKLILVWLEERGVPSYLRQNVVRVASDSFSLPLKWKPDTWNITDLVAEGGVKAGG